MSSYASFLPPLFEKIGREDLAKKFLDECRSKSKNTSIEIGIGITRADLKTVYGREKSTMEEEESKESDETKKSLERIEKMVTALYDRNLSDSRKKLFESMMIPQVRYGDFTSTLIMP
ncbi:hypothetical protein CHS0354_020282 [Potamilus streckersoni]|uniref:Uncharacterized protein n=1 Tax=Potamilus streckersoni TaxID=2493646 RepID=A0AAE0S5U1_9BIVA|nr:hypothetical protein CHS0354_020282 [Potamilus streckersoni]